jgi:hypothetical protein
MAAFTIVSSTFAAQVSSIVPIGPPRVRPILLAYVLAAIAVAASASMDMMASPRRPIEMTFDSIASAIEVIGQRVVSRDRREHGGEIEVRVDPRPLLTPMTVIGLGIHGKQERCYRQRARRPGLPMSSVFRMH